MARSNHRQRQTHDPSAEYADRSASFRQSRWHWRTRLWLVIWVMPVHTRLLRPAALRAPLRLDGSCHVGLREPKGMISKPLLMGRGREALECTSFRALQLATFLKIRRWSADPTQRTPPVVVERTLLCRQRASSWNRTREQSRKPHKVSLMCLLASTGSSTLGYPALTC